MILIKGIQALISYTASCFKKYRVYLLVIFTIFLISCIYGYHKIGELSPDEALAASKNLFNALYADNWLNEIVSRYFGSSIFWLILLKNTFVILLIIYSSLLTAGIMSLVIIIGNGIIVGTALKVLAVASNLPLYKIFLGGILPHGMLELPALFLAASLGLYMGTGMVVSLVRRRGFGARPLLKEAQTVVIRAVLPMLVAAALIETFVTPYIFMFIAEIL
ncbi:MAG: stage II sporulation protein M [Firmicutes bacterium]|nr:stage II sporulation protein M [Bacillota bacterium]